MSLRCISLEVLNEFETIPIDTTREAVEIANVQADSNLGRARGCDTLGGSSLQHGLRYRFTHVLCMSIEPREMILCRKPRNRSGTSGCSMCLNISGETRHDCSHRLGDSSCRLDGLRRSTSTLSCTNHPVLGSSVDKRMRRDTAGCE